MVKICSKCKETKPIDGYHKDKKGIFGCRSECKKCALILKKEYSKINADKIKIKNKKWRQDNKQHLKTYEKERLGKRREYSKKKYANDSKYREERKKTSKEYRSNPKNKNKIQLVKREYSKKRRMVDISYRILQSLRRRMSFVLNGKRKSESSIRLIGCTREELKIHLEKQFKEGMTWENYSLRGWHIDHIKPCASFDLSDPEQQKECFHYSNLQPLWWYENLSKGSKF